MKIKENNRCFYMERMYCQNCDDEHEVCWLSNELCKCPDNISRCEAAVTMSVVISRMADMFGCLGPDGNCL